MNPFSFFSSLFKSRKKPKPIVPMETEQFKAIAKEVFKSKGFKGTGSHFYLKFADLVIAVGLQRSSYSRAYYIETGYIVGHNLNDKKKWLYYKGIYRHRFLHTLYKISKVLGFIFYHIYGKQQ